VVGGFEAHDKGFVGAGSLNVFERGINGFRSAEGVSNLECTTRDKAKDDSS
jgi:hypothetical protein